jgi:mannose-6-phosphate isomerase-like protein (cupin superfamily)
MDHTVVNVQSKKPDEDQRSLRARVAGRESQVLRDTYFLIDGGNSPSKRLTMGYTTIYPTGTTTGHAHDDREEVYFVISGEGIMVIGEDEFAIKPGDGLYVPPGVYHTTKQTGNQPLTVLWVTGRVDAEDMQ